MTPDGERSKMVASFAFDQEPIFKKIFFLPFMLHVYFLPIPPWWLGVLHHHDPPCCRPADKQELGISPEPMSPAVSSATSMPSGLASRYYQQPVGHAAAADPPPWRTGQRWALAATHSVECGVGFHRAWGGNNLGTHKVFLFVIQKGLRDEVRGNWYLQFSRNFHHFPQYFPLSAELIPSGFLMEGQVSPRHSSNGSQGNTSSLISCEICKNLKICQRFSNLGKFCKFLFGNWLWFERFLNLEPSFLWDQISRQIFVFG